MKEYMSNFSAASFWDIPCLETVLVSEIDKTSKVSFTVSKQSERFLKKDKIIHLCEVALPTNAVVSKNGTMVASPELVFLQLACKLDIHRLILLGLQLCSHPPGNPSEAITTKHKLKSFLAKTPGHHGHRKALRAVKYIEDGSASVMESIAYMILTLPHALGGYGLDGTVFNHEIKLNNEAAKRLGQKRCFADLYYKQAKLAVEYESFAFHNSPMEQGKDAMRSAILERQNVEVMHLSTIQLYNKDACMDFAFNLASRIGKRMQIRAKEFDQIHGLLRTLLPVGKPVVESDNGEY
ncbi:MAG: hypothetical protein WC276_10075 [Sedimentibacter sp.]|jgi:hypothetical protein